MVVDNIFFGGVSRAPFHSATKTCIATLTFYVKSIYQNMAQNPLVNLFQQFFGMTKYYIGAIEDMWPHLSENFSTYKMKVPEAVNVFTSMIYFLC